VIPGLFLVLLGSAYLLTRSASASISELGSNLISELLGAAVIIFGIDYLIRRREEDRLLPIRASAYEDVRIMTHWALGLWRDAYEESVGDDIPSSWKELLSEDAINKVLISLDITKQAKVHPPQPWENYFDYVSNRIHKHAERVLERHGSFLDPEVHNAIYTLIYYGGHSISQIRAIDRHDDIPRPTNLGGYTPAIREWFDAVLTLHTWTIGTYEFLSSRKITNIHAPFQFASLQIKTTPPAAFSPGELQAQSNKFRQWQENKKGE
jgi:hypothetical protein